MQVADSLLHDESSNLETLIFCSQTLRSKVRKLNYNSHYLISYVLKATRRGEAISPLRDA
jgi:hypothetical protein